LYDILKLKTKHLEFLVSYDGISMKLQLVNQYRNIRH